MKIACIQPEILTSRKECYSEIEGLLNELLKEVDKCQIICLPEKWVPFFQDLPKNLQEERGQDYQFVRNLAKEYSVSFISGAIWEKRDSLKKPSITSYFFSNNGDEIGRQDKIHLYSYEREQFEPGNELNLFALDNSLFAILICFDMAFFETPRLATEHGADMLFSPTQIREEGMHNWNIYLQARALENRIPVIACNTVGNFFERKFLGKSKIISYQKGFISPSKLHIIEGPTGSGYVYDDINIRFPKKLRKIRLKEKVDKDKLKVNLMNN
jgi:predicted amidohydrolase